MGGWIGHRWIGNGHVLGTVLMTHSNASSTVLIMAFPVVVSIMWHKYLCFSAKMTFDSFAKANNPLKII